MHASFIPFRDVNAIPTKKLMQITIGVLNEDTFYDAGRTRLILAALAHGCYKFLVVRDVVSGVHGLIGPYQSGLLTLDGVRTPFPFGNHPRNVKQRNIFVVLGCHGFHGISWKKARIVGSITKCRAEKWCYNGKRSGEQMRARIECVECNPRGESAKETIKIGGLSWMATEVKTKCLGCHCSYFLNVVAMIEHLMVAFDALNRVLAVGATMIA